MSLAIAPLTLGAAPPATLVEAADTGGFRQVGLRFVDPAADAPAALLVPSAEEMRATELALDAAGVSVLEIEAVWLRPGSDVAALRPALEAGARLGVRILVASGDDAEPARLADRVSALVALSGGFGLRVALEFLPYAAVADLPRAAALAACCGAGLTIDALQLARSGGCPADVAALDNRLILHAQICDAAATAPPFAQLQPEALGSRLFPAEGALPLRAFCAALRPELTLSLKAPRAVDAGLSPAARAQIAMRALRGWIAEGERP